MVQKEGAGNEKDKSEETELGRRWLDRLKKDLASYVLGQIVASGAIFVLYSL